MSNRTVFVFALFSLVLSFCPSGCSCQNGYTFECSVCLQIYHRTYNSSTSNCDCGNLYMEMRPPGDHCRPVNCSTYTVQGCVSCKTNWQLYYNSNQDISVCVCSANYQYRNGDCECLSRTQPQAYYESIAKKYCKVCPAGCNCNSTGCFSCNTTVKRTVTAEANIMLCECTSPYVEIKGVCGVYPGCQVNGAVMTCNSSSLRVQVSLSTWVCATPYTDVDGVCTCLDPLHLDAYLRDSTQKICACNSKLYPTLYNEYKQVCTVCPTGCQCSNYGCYSCFSSVNRQIVAAGCPCASPYVEHSGLCICQEPYYLQTSNTSMSCVCLSEAYPAEFYYNPDQATCNGCPSGCTCNTSGCALCNNSTLRAINITTINRTVHYICSVCHYSAILVNNQCVCPPYSYFQNETASCVCNSTLNVYTNFSDSRKCLLCPIDCNCSSQLGCFSCNSSAMRTILTDGIYFTCPCNEGFSDVSGASCQCTFPYRQIDFNDSSSCVCSDPYELADGRCQCKSILNSTFYYFDLFNNSCFACPAGCICDQNGCSSCEPNALRFIIQYKRMNICPCLQSAFLTNGSCTYCSSNHKVVNGECVLCSTCASCDVLGCLSCNNDSTLVDHKCVCNNFNFTNIEGVCMCAITMYYQNSTNSCISCPKNCHMCGLSSSGLVKCISCRSEVNRMNAHENGCPCITGYKELSPVEEFCCQLKCKTCDQSGCVTCDESTNRHLQGTDCVCNKGYVDIGNGMCGCPNRTTSYSGVCINCPIHCNECGYNTTISQLYCQDCRKNVNRDVNDNACTCLDGFMQASIEIAYCVPNYCVGWTSGGVCTTCGQTRVLTNQGTACVCPPSFYDTGNFGICKNCSEAMQGCVSCGTNSSCQQCNPNGYSLTSTSNGTLCRKETDPSNLVVSQFWKGIYIHVRLGGQSANYSLPKSVSAELYSVYTFAPQTPATPTTLTVSSFQKLGNDVLEVILANPDVHFVNQLIYLKYTMINYTRRSLKQIAGSDQVGDFQGIEESNFIAQQNIYADSEVNSQRNAGNIATWIVTTVFVVIGLVLYFFGFKHNQLSFFMQTLALLSFTLDMATQMPPVLFPMKVAYYQCGYRRESTINIPSGYLESSSGNFAYFARDSNIFRVADITLLIALVAAILIFFLRLIYFLKEYSRLRNVPCVNQLSHSAKKSVYRILQFFYKTCMYPLIFFAIINIRNWGGRRILNQPEIIQFKSISLALSVIILVAYITVTIWQGYQEIAANVNRIQNVCEFVSAIVASLIIAFSIFSDAFLCLILVFAGRAVIYIITRKRFLRDFLAFEYMKGLTALFEIVTLCLINSRSTTAVIVFALATVSLQVSHEILIVFLTSRKARLDKLKKEPDTEGSSTADGSNFMIIYSDLGGVEIPTQQIQDVSTHKEIS